MCGAIVKLVPEKPDPVLLPDIFARGMLSGRIHKEPKPTASF